MCKMYVQYIMSLHLICFFYPCTELWCDETGISPFSEAAGTEEEENLDSVAFFGVHYLVSVETGQRGTYFR